MAVVGSGPAGQKAAVQAAKLSKRVAIIEKAPQLGGTSLNTGTLPSKTLKDTIEYLHGLGRRGLRQLGAELTKQLTLPDLMIRKDQVIETEVAGSHRSKPEYSTFMSSSVAIDTPELPTLP